MDVHEGVDRVGEAATSVIGNAAGTVVDPKTGLSKARKSLLTPKKLLTVAAFLVVALFIKRRR